MVRISRVPPFITYFLCTITFYTLLRSAISEFSKNPKYHIKVGMLIPRYSPKLIPLDGYTRSASAVMLAVERLGRENLLNDVNFTFVWKYEECNEHIALGYAVQLILNESIDLLVGPPCNAPAIDVGILTAYYDLPNFLWGPTTAAELSDLTRFPTVATVTADSFSLGVAICAMMKQYNWTEFGLIYAVTVAGTGNCYFLQEDLVQALRLFSNYVSLVYTRAIPVGVSNFTDVLDELRLRARIVVMCFEINAQKRRFMEAAKAKGMSNPEYVYIFPDVDNTGFEDIEGIGNYEDWTNSNYTKNGSEDTLEFFEYALVLDNKSDRMTKSFSEEVMNHMKDYPFYCTTDCPTNVTASRYAGSLYDTMYMYGLALNKSLDNDPINGWRNGSKILSYATGTFNGSTGPVIIGKNGTRSPVYSVDAIDIKGGMTTFATIRVEGNNYEFSPLYKDAATTIWARRGGKVPRSVPICGFAGDSCPFNFLKDYWGYVFAASALITATIIALIIGAIYMVREKIREAKRLNSMWQIAFMRLKRPDERSNSKSSHSLESALTSAKSQATSMADSEDLAHYTLDGELVYAEKFNFRVQLTKENFAELRMMRALENDNVNRFIGLVIDAPMYLIVWRHCSRGSLQDVIQGGKIQIDGFFAYCLMRDIVDGLAAIHSSAIGYHGMLTSANCLIDERWQVKIANFGLHYLRQLKKLTDDDLLWTAPEMLRDSTSQGTKNADMYSFAIIASELMCLTPPWNIGERKEQSAEIIYMVERGVVPPFRPDLTNIPHHDLNPALAHLIRDCWSEQPTKRPAASTVKMLIRKMNPGRTRNLMDHVFAMLEDYAGSLEAEVEARTKELIEEKKKSDILLYRMLPKQVAERLKVGQTVEPEAFDMVTVFFSDVVSFTKLAARCTPMQVVTLLNDLYTVFDVIIDAHDVYKVETIGDGYLCVSGLPKRNGNEHAREIANMALGFIQSLSTFRIAQMPDERINIRIGIHTGPCVAGVVGLTMPRYCLFGDTVNTASRMESNGKPGQIHLSTDANRFLTQILGGFVTVSRGEVIIKGKGVMETFWLLGREGETLIHAPDTGIYKKFTEEATTIK